MAKNTELIQILYILYKRKGLVDIIKPNNIYKGVLL